MGSVAEHLGVGVVDQGGDLILLQFQNDLRVTVRFGQTQERLDAIVAGHTETETQVQSLTHTLEDNTAGGRTLTSDQVSSPTVREATGSEQGVVPHDVATLGGGVVNDHAHAVVGGDEFLNQPSGEGLRRNGVQSVVADLIKEVTGLFHNGGTLSGAPVAGSTHKGTEVVKAGRVQQVVGFAGVHPVERPVLQTCLMLDADRGSASHGVCFVTGAAQVGDGLSEDAMLIQEGDGVVLVSNARVVNGTVGLEGHEESGERHPSELKVE